MSQNFNKPASPPRDPVVIEIARRATEGKVNRCYDCKQPIQWNDDAGVCIECGGRNLRLSGNAGGSHKP